jgi:iron complex transport system substrate-binding protein
MAKTPRVVSLLPSATEIAVALGLREQLVGRSHECDFPGSVVNLPVCTSTKLTKGLSSVEIERRVQEIVRQGLSVYEVDSALLRRLDPDVILTQSQCAVCAVTPRDLDEALATWVGREPLMLSLAPDTLEDVWGDFKRVGEAVDRSVAAEAVLDELQGRLDHLRRLSAKTVQRPSIAAIEWIDPLMAAGNWVPELVEIAGGEPLFAAPGQHSPWLQPEALFQAEPDIIVVMPCGYRIEQSLADMDTLTSQSRWRALKAVQNDRVFVADGHHFFNRPGPRLVESAEILSDIVQSCATDKKAGVGWCRLDASDRTLFQHAPSS